MRLLVLVLAALSAPLATAQSDSPSGSPRALYATPYAPLSSEAHAVAEAGAFGPTSDPLRMLDNPALLADLAGGVAVSGHRLPDWLGFGDASSQALGVAGGVRTTVAGRPASLAAGLVYGSFDQGGPYVVTDDRGNIIDEYDPGLDQTLALGLGGSVDGPVRVRAGASLRRYTSGAFSGLSVDGGGESDRASALTADLGLDVTAPVGRWLMPTPVGGFRLAADLGAGVALRSLGLAESSATVNGLESPISGRADRTTVTGISVLLGVDAGLGTRRALRAASVEFMTTAEGLDGSGLSAQAIVLGRGDPFEPTVARRGYRLTLAETLVLSAGSMRGDGFVERDARGATLSLGGALRLAGILGASDGVREMGRRADLRYTYASYTFGDDNPFDRTASHALTLRLSR